jgi:hypothetical protein
MKKNSKIVFQQSLGNPTSQSCSLFSPRGSRPLASPSRSQKLRITRRHPSPALLAPNLLPLHGPSCSHRPASRPQLHGPRYSCRLPPVLRPPTARTDPVASRWPRCTNHRRWREADAAGCQRRREGAASDDAQACSTGLPNRASASPPRHKADCITPWKTHSDSSAMASAI